MTVLRWIKNNVDLKIWSVVLALLVWFHVATERIYTTTYTASLAFINPPKGWTLVGSPPEEVSMRLRGTGKQLISHRIFGEPSAVVELPRDKSRTVKMNLNPNDVILTRRGELEIASIVSPAEFELDMDAISKKNVPVELVLEGEPRKGCVQIGRATLTPDKVELTGGKNNIRKIVRLRTEPLIIQGESKSVERTIAIAFPQGVSYRSKPDSVLARVTIEKIEQKILEQLPVAITETGSGTTAAVSTQLADVTLAGAESRIALVDSSNVQVSVDVSGLGPGTHLIPPKVTGPEDIEVLSIEPELIQVDIE